MNEIEKIKCDLDALKAKQAKIEKKIGKIKFKQRKKIMTELKGNLVL